MQRYHLSRIFQDLREERLNDRRMITVNGAATGSRDRSRYSPSATSTSIPEADDGNWGRGGSISCACSLLCLLTQQTLSKQPKHLSYFSPPNSVAIPIPAKSVSHSGATR